MERRTEKGERMQAAYRGLIVDTHMHVWRIDPPRYTLEQTLADVPLPTTDALIEDLLADNAAAGVAHTVLVQPSTSGWNNRYVVESAVAHPNLFAAHGLIDPDSKQNATDLRRWMTAGMAGGAVPPPARTKASACGRTTHTALRRASELTGPA